MDSDREHNWGSFRRFGEVDPGFDAFQEVHRWANFRRLLGTFLRLPLPTPVDASFSLNVAASECGLPGSHALETAWPE